MSKTHFYFGKKEMCIKEVSQNGKILNSESGWEVHRYSLCFISVSLKTRYIFTTGKAWGSRLTCHFFLRFKKSMVKGLDSYEEKEDEVIKEVS